MAKPSRIEFAAGIVLMLTASMAAAQQTPPAARALERFQAAVTEYASLHRQVVHSLPPLRVTPDVEEIGSRVEARGAAIRTARAGARSGDIFGEAGELLRTRIRTALAGKHAVEALLADINDETPTEPVVLVVNGRAPWAAGAMMPAAMLEVLPPLPEELEYRFVGRDLVLVDIDAGVIVDILPAALASLT